MTTITINSTNPPHWYKNLFAKFAKTTTLSPNKLLQNLAFRKWFVELYPTLSITFKVSDEVVITFPSEEQQSFYLLQWA